ncbi:hypothetical protein D3C78_1536440 [compost metagenome]
MGGVFGDPQTVVVTEQETGLAQPFQYHRVRAVWHQLVNMAEHLFGVEQATVRAVGNCFGLIQAGAQGSDVV